MEPHPKGFVMNTIQGRTGILIMLAFLAIASGCGNDDPVDPTGGGGNQQPGNLPAIPVPNAPTDLLPNESEAKIIGLSTPLPDFQPMVTESQMMLDDGSEPWLAMNRHLIMACDDVLPKYTNDPAAMVPGFLSDRPYLLHTRHWRKLMQVTLGPGTTYSQAETITYGTSTSHEESTEFSQTMGIEVTVGGGWGPFSASVTASYEQTSTHGEVNSVSFSEETSVEQTYAVESDPTHTRVYALWQLVDRFSMVDADTVRIHDSDILTHVRITEIADIEFPNESVIYQSITAF
jgi:hypothetical protein